MVAGVRDDGCARLDEIAFDLLYEDHASASERALIGDLLVKAFGWRHRPTAGNRAAPPQHGAPARLHAASSTLPCARVGWRPARWRPDGLQAELRSTRGTSVRFRRCGRPSGLATVRNRAGDWRLRRQSTRGRT